jgi:uncharacterized membrane protein
MGFLVAKVGCSIAVALLLKHADQLKLNRMSVIRINYAAAAILSFLLVVTQPSRHISGNTIWVAVIAGLSYVAALVLWSQAIQESGLALTVGVNRLAIIVPVLSSIFIWKEIPRLHQGIGIVLGILAMLVIGRESRNKDQPRIMNLRRQLLLIALFISAGIANLSSKLFDEMCRPEENYQFQALLFIVAYLVTTVLYYRQKERTDTPVVQWGAMLGAVNLGSSIFIILALQVMTGAIVFSISAALEVAVIAVLGRVIWKERLSRLSIIGLVMAVAALVLVQLH